jgi:uncharacterized protein (TIGR04255 family)
VSDASVRKFAVDSTLAVAEPLGDVFGRPRYQLAPGSLPVPFWTPDPSHLLTLVMARAVAASSSTGLGHHRGSARANSMSRPRAIRPGAAPPGCEAALGLVPRLELPIRLDSCQRFGCRFGCCRSIMPLMDEVEVYPSAPIVLAAMELRHPTTEALTAADRRAIKSLVAARVPILKSAQMVQIQVTTGGSSPETTTEEFPRFFSRDSTLSVSFRRDAIVVESSNYLGWDNFRVLAINALDARRQVSAVDGIERIGLRYIDEIRVPDASPIDWAKWVANSVVGPDALTISGLPIAQWQGTAVYGEQPGRALVLRYGPREGFAVDPNGDLKRKTSITSGPFFLIDIDSFWIPPEGTPEFDVEKAMKMADELHVPVRTLFDSLVTDRLKDEVLRRA